MIKIHSFLKQCFSPLWKQGPSADLAGASLEKFGEKVIVFFYTEDHADTVLKMNGL